MAGFRLHGMFNAYWEPLSFAIPDPAGGAGVGWGRWIDTARSGPDAITAWEAPAPTGGDRCRVEARSTCVLWQRLLPRPEPRAGLS